MYNDNSSIKIPGIDSYIDEYNNPTIKSENSDFELSFPQTRDTFMDIELYKRFLDNAISRFRRSVRYKKYKGFLCSLGMDRCQIHSMITEEMATLEMHHAIIQINDIALMICEHIINTTGYITTFDLVQALKEEHSNHNIALMMMSKTPHQVYHNNPDFIIHPNMCIGNWTHLLEKYKYGITQDIALKLIYYLNKATELGYTDDGKLLELREQIKEWSEGR